MNSEVADFYKGRSVFITGITGFLGKVLVEKLLRSCGEIKYIYVLLRSKRGQCVSTRLNNLFHAKIFEKLLDCEPQTLTKVKAIEGDITLPGLGISEDDLKTLVRDVSVVFHSAATVKFDEPLKTAVNFNLLGTRKVAELCRKLPKLMALIHVSTAYSNCNRYEIDERVYPSAVPIKKIIGWCETMTEENVEVIAPGLMEGFPNTYTYTKHLAESLLTQECQDLPIAIIRPSIVTSSWKEPMPGWIDSVSGVTGYLLASGKGIFRQALIKKKARADLIPVDVVINVMVSLVWFTATHRPKDIKVYNCTSGSLNPFTWGEVVTNLGPPFSTEFPSTSIYRYPSVTPIESHLVYKIKIFFDHVIPAHIYDGIMVLVGGKRFMVNLYDKIHKSYTMMIWFATREFQFSNNNLLMLDQILSEDDRLIFGFDIRSLNWSKYWSNYYLGVRQFIMKESNETLPEARNHLRRVYLRDVCLEVLFFILASLTIMAFYLYYFN